MKDLGQPSSYLALQERALVYSSDGKELGKVEHVLADPDVDVFDGIVLDLAPQPHRGLGGRARLLLPDGARIAPTPLYSNGSPITISRRPWAVRSVRSTCSGVSPRAKRKPR